MDKITSSEVTDLVVEASERMGKVPLACNDSLVLSQIGYSVR